MNLTHKQLTFSLFLNGLKRGRALGRVPIFAFFISNCVKGFIYIGRVIEIFTHCNSLETFYAFFKLPVSLLFKIFVLKSLDKVAVNLQETNSFFSHF